MWAPGIIFLIIGLAMCFVSDWNDKVLNEWLWFEMFLQVLGLMRYSTYPIVANAYNILQGFSVMEFLYVPNLFANLFPAVYGEVSYPIVSFVNVNHNFVINVGSELLIFLFIQVPIIIVLIWKRQAILQKILRIEEILITLFFCRTFFSCVVSFIGLGLNIDLVGDATFFACQVVGFVFLMLYLGYFIIRVRAERSLQLYKLNILLVIIAIPFMNRLLTPCLFFINLIEVVFFAIDFYFYRDEKTNKWAYIAERLLMLIGYNVAVIVQSLIPLIIILILVVIGLMSIKSWVFYQEWKNKPIPAIEPSDVKIVEEPLGVQSIEHPQSKEYIGVENSASNIMDLDHSSDKLEATPNKAPNVFDQDDSPVHNTHENTQVNYQITQNNLIIFVDESPETRPRTNKRLRSQKLETLKSEPK